MSQPFIREFRLAGRLGKGLLPFINNHGVWRGIDTPLLEQDRVGTWRPRPKEVLETVLSAGYGLQVSMERRMSNLAVVARAMNRGDTALAAIALVHAEFPPLPDESGARRMRWLDTMLKYNPDELRVPAGEPAGGQWTTEGRMDTGETDPQPTLVADNRPFNTVSDATAEKRAAKERADEAKYPSKTAILADGSTVYDPYKKDQMRMPEDVSLQRNAELGAELAKLPEWERDLAMADLFRPRGDMDYQRTHSSDSNINHTYMAFGNFNYGVVAAAAGLTLDDAQRYAAWANHFGSGPKSGKYGGNPDNITLIERGYDAYKSANIPRDEP